MEAALDTVLKVARAHINYDLRHGRQPLSAFAAAPRLYWEAFTGATRVDIRLDLAGEEPAMPMQVIAAAVPQHPIVKLYCARAERAELEAGGWGWGLEAQGSRLEARTRRRD